MDGDTTEFHWLYVTNEYGVEAGGAHASKTAKGEASPFVVVQR